MLKLVIITNIHMIGVMVVSENKVFNGVIKYISKVKIESDIKLKLKNLFLKILVLKIDCSVLQFMA